VVVGHTNYDYAFTGKNLIRSSEDASHQQRDIFHPEE
jgi:hypothetical protein